MDMRESISKNIIIIKNRGDHWSQKYFPEFNDIFVNWEVKAALISHISANIVML